ncbi:TetR family transcriptional regulator [Nonomuraea sp. NPDC003214]
MGLRERKKEKTRLALLDAALDLFLEQGYDSTTVEQIAGAVDVSSRTFFRYFTSKDHLLLWYHDQGEETMLETLAARPPDEPPFAAMTHAVRAVLREMEQSTTADTERFLKLRRVLDDNPHLVAFTIARGMESELRLAEAVAARMGVTLDSGPLPALVVAFAMSPMRVDYGCASDVLDLKLMVRRVEQTLQVVERSLRPGWDT